MRDLLRRRQEEQLTKRTATGETRPVSTHGQLRELRRELNTLVSLAHHRTGKPYGWIHKELRSAAVHRSRPRRQINYGARIDAVRELETVSYCARSASSAR